MTHPVKSVAITGGAGFIGSHLVDACVARGLEVSVIDDLSVGQLDYLDEHLRAGRARFVRGDILDRTALQEALDGTDTVFHLAANPDARRGLENPRVDLELEVLTTFEVLEAMRQLGIPRIVFASSGTVYGDVGTRELSEDYGPCQPISLYGAGKAAAEAFLSAYAASFGLQATACRLGNVIGERATHGALYDFLNKLRQHRATLEILGNGRQAKPYIYVRELGLADTQLRFGATPAGWTGDIPQSRMNADKLARLGWAPRYTSDEAVEVGVREFVRTEVARCGPP